MFVFYNKYLLQGGLGEEKHENCKHYDILGTYWLINKHVCDGCAYYV